MGSLGINENDLDSPGYEFLRSHQNMVNLYYKLIALDYQRDFCPAYKCPPINRYYFSRPHKNNFEQQYVFTCLCAWLIRDKCQMNFDLDLEDMTASISVIFEALKLLHEDEDGQLNMKIRVRLELGYGPEVIYALSCFADRALEVALEQDPSLGSSPKIYFHNKLHDQTRTTANSITIGQPIVGGTLTTRSLGKYFIEDSSLVLDYQDLSANQAAELNQDADAQLNPDEWEQQVAKVAGQLKVASNNLILADTFNSVPIPESKQEEEDWLEHLKSVSISKRAIQSFLDQSKCVMQAVETRIGRQMQVVGQRERFLQTNLSEQLEGFLRVWRERCSAQKSNEQLMKLVNARTDLFESYNSRLKMLAGDIETRIRELNDGSKLRQLESVTSKLETQSDVLDVKVGLLLAVYGDGARVEAKAQPEM